MRARWANAAQTALLVETGGRWIYAQPGRFAGYDEAAAIAEPYEPRLDRARAEASLPRDAFLIAAMGQGVISEAEAISLSQNVAPQSLVHDLQAVVGANDMPALLVRVNAATIVPRLSDTVAVLMAARNVTDETADAIFGVK